MLILFASGVLADHLNRSEADEICCPVHKYNRVKTLAIQSNPKSRMRRLVPLHQTESYKQHLVEVQCKYPNQRPPIQIRLNDSRCNGYCEQKYDSQKMLAIQLFPRNVTVENIEVKVGCKFLRNLSIEGFWLHVSVIFNWSQVSLK